ncbi:unnamed protein product [Fraxinus pennsylvanica]|uniref:Peptidase S8/S53 domain-containing protein n=1 Tax=Fraxinus pennsylvanica TaxID=56036 RepID=A0AAD2EH68_9LAMI|nr:unnamed protein product [Fraxinus pennsylvanica]
MDSVISVFHSDPTKLRLHTTRSWDFINLLEGIGNSSSSNAEELLRKANYGKDIVVGVLDTGNLNRKIIGAHYYLKGYEAYFGRLNTSLDFRSPRDKRSHGTHTSSTIGGRRVSNVYALGGFASGTATGGAPLVRLAMYKVCWPVPGYSLAEGNACLNDDILAAFDDAIKDGVRVISVSMGS